MNKSGETSLSTPEIQELAPELTSQKGQLGVASSVIHANHVKPALDQTFKMIAMQAGLDPNNDFISRIKDPRTIIEKVAEHRKGGEPDYSLADINDTYGGRIIAKTPEQKANIVNQIRGLANNNQIKLLQEQAVNRDQYHAYHMDFNAGGVNGELQIHDPASYAEATLNHPLYNEYAQNAPQGVKDAEKSNAQLAAFLPPQLSQQLGHIIEIARQHMGAQ